MDNLINDIKDICLAGDKTAYSRLKKIFILLGGEGEEFVKAHEKPADTELDGKKRLLREHLLSGYIDLTGAEMPCTNWPKWSKAVEKAASALTLSQIEAIRIRFLETVKKKKSGLSLTYDDRYIISHYTAEGLAHHTAPVLSLCVVAKAEKKSFTAGRL